MKPVVLSDAYIYALQIAELEEHKKDSLRRIDDLERSCAAATKDTQQHEAQVSSLNRQLREAQVTVRNAEKEMDQVLIPQKHWCRICVVKLLLSSALL
jgi:peptidoglycan hydrolase CwlO-like protein